MVDEQHEDRADDRADEAGRLSRRVPAHRLAQIGRDERAHDTEDGGDDEATGVTAGHEKLRHQADHETDDDCPDDAHGSSSREALIASNLASSPGDSLLARSDSSVGDRAPAMRRRN